MTDELPVWKRWTIGAGVLVFWTGVFGGAWCLAADHIDTIAEQPTPKCCRIYND